MIAPSRKVLSALPEGDPRKAIIGTDEFRGEELMEMEFESEAEMDESCWWGSSSWARLAARTCTRPSRAFPRCGFWSTSTPRRTRTGTRDATW
jgi:hypothetical protein